jgi:uncharacterized lipoprotein YehR (DUF1307 family)
MHRKLLALLIAVAPLAMILSLTGCGDKVKSVKKSERQEESTPTMVSPGEEVLE